MSKLLIEEPPLQVLPTLATMIGLNEAIVLQQIHYWLLKAEVEHEGRKWVYNTYEAWQEQFPFWSARTIRRTLTSLRDKGLVLSGQFAENPHDKTNYYTIDYAILNALPESLCPDPSGQVVHMGMDKMASSPSTETTKEPQPEKTGEQISDKHFGPRPAREKELEADFLKDLSPKDRAFALASGLAAAEHEKRGTGMAVTPEQEGESLLRKFCEIHDAPMPRAERVRIRQARILVQCKEGVEADSQACERALAVLKEEYAFRTYNSVDDKGFQRDFAAEAHRAMQSRSKRSASEPQPLRTKDWATGKWVDWEQGEATND